MMYGWDGYGSGMWIMMLGVFLIFLLFFGLIAFLGVTALRRNPMSTPPAVGPSGTGRAKQILDERLARGEVTPEDYERLRVLLHSSGSNDLS